MKKVLFSNLDEGNIFYYPDMQTGRPSDVAYRKIRPVKASGIMPHYLHNQTDIAERVDTGNKTSFFQPYVFVKELTEV